MNESDQRPDEGAIDTLYALRKEAVNTLTPNLKEVEGMEPAEKFDLYMSALRQIHDVTVVADALAVAKQISDKSTQTDALLELIDEINYQISHQEITTDTKEQSNN